MRSAITGSFGNIDIYLFDQLQKGRFDDCKSVLDAGCGSGRNIHYFLKNDYNVYGVDINPAAIAEVQILAQRLSPELPAENFFVAAVEELPFKYEYFDLVICSAVLHFANDNYQFDKMLIAMFRVLKPGGFFFCRLASNIGIEHLAKDIGGGRYLLPDGTERFLVDQQMLLDYTSELNGQLFEPVKTTNVQNLRCMSTWCVQKN